MKISDAVRDFIAIVSTHFPPPRFADERSELDWVQSMERNLGTYKPNVLIAAANLIVDERGESYGQRKFPLPKECRQACHQVLARQKAEAHGGRLPLSEQEARPRNGFAGLADDMLTSPDGKAAARGGYVLGWHDFIRREGRVPTPREIETIKRETAEFDAAYAKCVRGGWPEAQALERLGASMLAKREAYRNRALGECL